MELRDIEYFAAIAERGHVGRTADALGISQSALSKCLRRLERSTGTKLVQRTPKGIELTAVGSALLSHVRRLRLAHEDIARELADLSQGHAGHLRVACNPGFTEAVVGMACATRLNEASKVTFKVTIIDTFAASLRSGEFDLAVSGSPATPSEDLIHEHLIDDVFVVYASVNHRLIRRNRLILADLVQERWASSEASVSWQGLRRAFEEQGLPSPRLAVSSNAMSVRYRAVAGSDLLGFTAKAHLRQAAPQFPLVELPVKKLSWGRRFGVSYRKGAYLSPAAKRFIEILKATAKEIAAEKP